MKLYLLLLACTAVLCSAHAGPSLMRHAAPVTAQTRRFLKGGAGAGVSVRPGVKSIPIDEGDDGGVVAESGDTVDVLDDPDALMSGQGSVAEDQDALAASEASEPEASDPGISFSLDAASGSSDQTGSGDAETSAASALDDVPATGIAIGFNDLSPKLGSLADADDLDNLDFAGSGVDKPRKPTRLAPAEEEEPLDEDRYQAPTILEGDDEPTIIDSWDEPTVLGGDDDKSTVAPPTPTPAPAPTTKKPRPTSKRPLPPMPRPGDKPRSM